MADVFTYEKTHFAVLLRRCSQRDALVSGSATERDASLSTNTVLEHLEIQRGNDLDSRDMIASCRSGENQTNSKKRWSITISFENADGM